MKNLIRTADSRRMKSLSLRFTPRAWAKLLFLRDRGATEVGGFGISDPDDLLLLTDLALVDQLCSVASVEFADSAVADFFDQQVDGGRSPAQFARIWVHTHPGNSPVPSSVDEDTFARVFGQSDWAVMFILAQHGQTSCRLQLNAGPTGAIEIPVCVDYSQPFEASDHASWEAEYRAKVEASPDVWFPKDAAVSGDRMPLIGRVSDLKAAHDEYGFESNGGAPPWEDEYGF